MAPSIDASPPAPARPRRLPPPPASSPCWSTASCPATSSITIPALPLITSSTAPVNSSRCANAPNYLATNWSISPPVRYSQLLFLERDRLGTRDCLARERLVGGAQFSAAARGRAAARSLDDFPDADAIDLESHRAVFTWVQQRLVAA